MFLPHAARTPPRACTRRGNGPLRPYTMPGACMFSAWLSYLVFRASRFWSSSPSASKFVRGTTRGPKVPALHEHQVRRVGDVQRCRTPTSGPHRRRMRRPPRPRAFFRRPSWIRADRGHRLVSWSIARSAARPAKVAASARRYLRPRTSWIGSASWVLDALAGFQLRGRREVRRCCAFQASRAWWAARIVWLRAHVI